MPRWENPILVNLLISGLVVTGIAPLLSHRETTQRITVIFTTSNPNGLLYQFGFNKSKIMLAILFLIVYNKAITKIT